MATKEQLAKEMAELQALLASLNNGQIIDTKAPETPGTGTAGFKVTRRVEASEKYGVEYSFIKFVDAEGKGIPGAPTKDDTLGFEAKNALKAARYGQQGKGKFRWDRNARAFSGQTEFIPQIVKDHIVK